jgi:hypothetical protein
MLALDVIGRNHLLASGSFFAVLLLPEIFVEQITDSRRSRRNLPRVNFGPSLIEQANGIAYVFRFR